jgi:threonine aldolase
MFCLSKGLSAPVGSLLCGSREFIERARRNRKMVGGGTRQVGAVAAAGIVALETMIERLAEDHANARALAERLAALPEFDFDPEDVETNIIAARLRNGAMAEVLPRLTAAGVQATALGPTTLRFVTHYPLDRAAVDEAAVRIEAALREPAAV